ncbi:MAG: phosphoribosylglycinamide formyltransferase [Rhodanobacter sp.]
MSALPRIAVLASGRGSNLAALIAARDNGTLPVEITLVGSNKAEAPALRLAEAAGIATLALDPRSYPDRLSFDLDMLQRVAASGAQWLVLAGYMRILAAEAVRPWVGRIINIHPSLLPKYRGLHTHLRALEAGDTDHGASVHFVTAELDGGPVIAQAHIALQQGDDEDQLAARLLPLEHQLLPAVLRLLASRELQWGEPPVFHGQPLLAPLVLAEDGTLVAR